MAFTLWLLLFPLGSAAYRVKTLGSGASNVTGGGGRLEAGLCQKCDKYTMGVCTLCPNCKWRGGMCMHRCTACCAYKRGCKAAYCACDGKTNVFRGMWKACGSQGKEKSYNFQMRVPLEAGDRSKDMHIAVRLRRSAADPQLILYYNQEWTIRVRREQVSCHREGERLDISSGVLLEERSAGGHGGRGNGSNASGSEPHGGSLLETTSGVSCPYTRTLSWAPMPASPGADTRTEVIHLNDVQHIRVFKAQLGEVAVTALEIKYPDSDKEPFTIYGGLYVPKFLVTHALDLFWPTRRGPPKDDGSGIYVAKPVSTYKPRRSRHDPPRLTLQIAHVRVSKLLEFLDRHLKRSGQSLPNKHRHAVAASTLPAAIVGEVGAITGALAGVVLASAAGPLLLPAVALGSLAGAGLPYAGTVWGTHKATMEDSKREASLLASEKIFEKMRCHRLFLRCSGAVIAPARGNGRCPPVGSRAALMTGGTAQAGWESTLVE